MTDQFEESNTLSHAALLPAGRQLRNAREALELTPEQVAQQLKLSVRQVFAIEQEAFDELPSNLFIRGFVRNYARLVQIDAAPLLSYLAEVLPTEQAATTLLDASAASGIILPKTIKHQRRLSLTWLMMGLGLALGIAAVVWFLQQPANPELALPEVNTPPVVDLPSVPVVIEVSPAPAGMGSGAAVVANTNSAVTPAPTAQVSSVMAASAVALSKEAIKVSSSTDSWVQIVDADGNKVLSEIVRPGVEHNVDGKPPFIVKVGNAPKTQLYFHGRNVDLSAYLKPGSDVVNLELK